MLQYEVQGLVVFRVAFLSNQSLSLSWNKQALSGHPTGVAVVLLIASIETKWSIVRACRP